MMDIVNQFLLYYMVPVILCFLLTKQRMRIDEAEPNLLDVFFVLMPAFNWVVAGCYLFVFLCDLFINIVIAVTDVFKEKLLGDRSIAERFFRMKDEE